MSRQAVVASIVTVLGVAGVALWSVRVDRQGVSIALWFDEIGPDASMEFSQRAGGPLTPGELARIRFVAQDELHAAFAGTCLQVASSPAARYGVSVRPDLPGLVAGQSRSLPGLRGNGAISFASLAASAVAFAPAGTGRDALVDAIGRGIGRTAAHELAHQLLGGFQLHDTRDRSSYEYPDLRPEHFYGVVHWTLAAAPLQARFGRGSDGCREAAERSAAR